MWGDYLQNLRGAKVWREVRYANPRAGTTLEDLTNKDGNIPNRSFEKEEILWHEYIPPNNGDQHYKLPPARSAHNLLTELAVERALYSQSFKNDPGLEKLSFGAIRLLWK